MTISDIPNGGLIPIYELVSDQDRKQKLIASWNEYMASNTSQLLTEEIQVVKKNDGRYLVKAPYHSN